MGELEVPDDAYYGIQTLRAIRNFPVSGRTEPPELIEAYMFLKKACARANMQLGALDHQRGEAIVQACDNVLAGGYEDQFPVDVFQAGAGTSFNMNVNEVIANRALEIMGKPRGSYTHLHPNDHVNMSQSSNDTFPTASHMAVISAADVAIAAIHQLADAFEEKAREFITIGTSGRTHLTDATPVTLGDEFRGYEAAIRRQAIQLTAAQNALLEVAIGSTATGTGINTPEGYRQAVIEQISDLTGRPFRPARNSFEALQSRSQLTAFSHRLRQLSIELIRIANDLRLKASGPQTGLAELQMPAVQPGSSIMPGKINPVMAECLNMICFHIVGCSSTVDMAAQAGQLELNVMTPIITFEILESLSLMRRYLPVFVERCIKGIRADSERCRTYLESSPSLVTFLSPKIGYLAAADLARESVETGVSVPKLAVKKGILTEQEAAALFDSARMAANTYREDERREKD